MQSMAEPPKGSSTGGSPPAVANPPDGLPSDREMRDAELGLRPDEPPIQLDSPLKLGDRKEDITRGKEEEARREAMERASLAALRDVDWDESHGEVPPEDLQDTSSDDLASPSVMAQYWELVREDGIEPPTGQDHFRRPVDAYAAIKRAWPVLGNEMRLSDDPELELLRRKLGLALMGITNHVPLEAFRGLVRKARAEQTAANIVAEELVQTATAPEPASVQDEVTGDPSADDQKLLRGFAASIARQRGEWDIPAPPRRRTAGRRLEPAPALIPTPAPVKRPKRATATRGLVYAIALVLLLFIGLSSWYLWDTQQAEHKTNQAQDQTLAEHGIQLRELDSRTADVISALADEKTQVITLTRERDSYQGLATSFRDALEADTREDARTRIGLTVKVNRVEDQLTATQRELERMREEMRAMGREPAQETPSP